MARRGVPLQKVVDALKRMAPLHLAGSWDNVGLLVEPSQPQDKLAFFTNDLTEPVCDEALSLGADIVISYHPPLFRAIKRLTASSGKDRILLKAIEAKMAVWDAVAGGVNDWLASGVCADDARCVVSVVEPEKSPARFKVCVQVEAGRVDDIVAALTASRCDGVFVQAGRDSGINVVEATCQDKALETARRSVVELVAPDNFQVRRRGVLAESAQAIALTPASETTLGQGRVVTLSTPITLDQFVERIKSFLKLAHVRVGYPEGGSGEKLVRRVALCAGSGWSVISRCKADVYLTGEMGHHDAAAAVAKGAGVVLCEHSNTERGSLPVMAERLLEQLQGDDPDGDGIQTVFSKIDADPLVVV